MSGHNSGGRFVIAEMKRRWSLAEKKAIVAESVVAPTSISAVARKHGLAPSLLFRWRREVSGVQISPARPAMPARTQFMPVCLPAAGDACAAAHPIIIEIELAQPAVRLRVDVTALARVLDVLGARPVCRSLGEGR
jgi:transposase